MIRTSILSLALLTAGCAAIDSGVGVPRQAGSNLVGEACSATAQPATGGDRLTTVQCGNWEQPSARVLERGGIAEAGTAAPTAVVAALGAAKNSVGISSSSSPSSSSSSSASFAPLAARMTGAPAPPPSATSTARSLVASAAARAAAPPTRSRPRPARAP